MQNSFKQNKVSLKQPQFAHTSKHSDGAPNPDESKWQLLRTHLANVALKAKEFAQAIGMAGEAELAGWLHDLGKYSKRFQARLRDPAIKGINHWAHGTEEAYKLSPIVAYAVDGHHTGIPAATDLRQTLLKLRADTNSITGYEELLPTLLQALKDDGIQLPAAFPPASKDRFAEAMRVRFLFSCLVDADYLDTEQHFAPHKTPLRAPEGLEHSKALVQILDLLNSKADASSINQLRKQLLDDCLIAADKPKGLFNLTAPTGSGKTLASLAFALKHIQRHNAGLPADAPNRLRRIIVVIPYTSIIDQTAQVYREVLAGLLGKGTLVEHYSTAIPPFGEEIKSRFAMENWDAPIVITTNAQFFQSLCSNRPSACRKLHNIAGSVVLFDEVQTLPPRLVPSLLAGVKLLTRDYNTTAVFMTATQPAFKSAGPSLKYSWNPVEISSRPNELAQALKRTNIQLPKPGEVTSWQAVADQMLKEQQALCVVNSTKDARTMFRLLPEKQREHLSARMCPAHRQEVIKRIRAKLAANESIYLASTQVIEAGVNVDFFSAFRANGPLDSLIQTAGRCNREGKSKTPGKVVVFNPEDGSMPRGVYQTAADITSAFLSNNPDIQLHLPETYERYFEELYRLIGPNKAAADQVVKLSELFDFPAAAEACKLIEDNTYPVLVPWGESAQLLAQVKDQDYVDRDTGRKIQRFMVNIYEPEFKKGTAQGFILQPIPDVELYVWNAPYDPHLGACPPEA